jgi:hypothetical protein
MLEAYMNLHATEELYGGEHLIPQHSLERLKKLSVKHRYQQLPRLAGRLDSSDLDQYESHEIHKTIERVFAQRNKFVHGDLEQWDPLLVTTADVARLWNGALEALLVLETLGKFRIPKSRLEDYEAELAKFRFPIP